MPRCEADHSGADQRQPARFLCAAAALAFLCFLSAAHLAVAADKAKEKTDDYTLLVVSVFTKEGFSLPGTVVRVKREQARKPKWKGMSGPRGEIAFRLPVEPATYTTSTHSKNRENETRTVEIQDKRRVDIIFRLPVRTGKQNEKEAKE